MLSTRIIPCLDVHNGRTVKGINFLNLQDAGDPVEQAKLYSEVGADEICFLDISATNEQGKQCSMLYRKPRKRTKLRNPETERLSDRLCAPLRRRAARKARKSESGSADITASAGARP